MLSFVWKDGSLHLECFEGRVVIRVRTLALFFVAAFIGSVTGSYLGQL